MKLMLYCLKIKLNFLISSAKLLLFFIVRHWDEEFLCSMISFPNETVLLKQGVVFGAVFSAINGTGTRDAVLPMTGFSLQSFCQVIEN